jgi:cyanate permease
LHSSNADTVEELSSILQFIGYLIAATRTFLIGLIHDSNEEWNYAPLILISANPVKFLVILFKGKPGTV